MVNFPVFIYGPTELLAALRKGNAADSLPAIGQAGGLGFTGLSALGGDSVRLRGGPYAMVLRFDAANRLQSLDGRGTTNKVVGERASGRENFWVVHLVLAAAYANHGEMAKAVAAKAEALRTVPGLTIAQLRAKRGSDNPEYLKRAEEYWYEGLRKAGVPEK
jgi:hypothetical protein